MRDPGDEHVDLPAFTNQPCGRASGGVNVKSSEEERLPVHGQDARQPEVQPGSLLPQRRCPTCGQTT